MEIEGLQNALQQAEVTAKSDVALMEQRHAAEISDSAAKVCYFNCVPLLTFLFSNIYPTRLRS